ncbi:UBA/TS-N domain-containing protein [Coniochaeta sp. 2T2.1]|nr:UBA/TS-N domain-containing protein [Coniochaeta sp. 2T2.1]
MAQTDLELLLEMGFEKARAELAVKKTGGLQGALTWLEQNQDKSLDELQAQADTAAASAEDGEDEGAPKIPAVDGENAKSLVCNDCGKRFKNEALASYHASKTDHTDFSESTEEIAPLTEEQKAAKLEELRERLAAKRAAQAEKDKEEHKRNEQIRMKSTKETQDLKEELKRKEQLKEVEKKKAEKAADLEAKRRIKAKIEADKEERRRKAEEAKAAREGRAPAQAAAPAPAAPTPAAARPAANHTEARLRLQTSTGNVLKTFPADTTLFEVAQALESEHQLKVESFSTTFPRKTWSQGMDFGQTLKEAGCVPSAVLIVK